MMCSVLKDNYGIFQPGLYFNMCGGQAASRDQNDLYWCGIGENNKGMIIKGLQSG